MFRWLLGDDPESSGLARMNSEFSEMLQHGRHVFDAAANAFLGGTDPEVVRDDLFATDRKINRLEQRIRREVLVHGTVHGVTGLPACLVLMSIVKDAERIGDYSKNLFEVAIVGPKSKDDDYYADLVENKNRISRMLQECRDLHSSQNVEAARAFLKRCESLSRHCDAQVDLLLGPAPGTDQAAATVLAYRYLKRVVAHMHNIVTSIVMPVDQLDYFEKDKGSYKTRPATASGESREE